MTDNIEQIDIVAEVRAEWYRAMDKFPPMHSAHEGYAVLKEEVDELWDAIKTKGKPGMREEAIQVAAMALRFINDVCPE